MARIDEKIGDVKIHGIPPAMVGITIIQEPAHPSYAYEAVQLSWPHDGRGNSLPWTTQDKHLTWALHEDEALALADMLIRGVCELRDRRGT